MGLVFKTFLGLDWGLGGQVGVVLGLGSDLIVVLFSCGGFASWCACLHRSSTVVLGWVLQAARCYFNCVGGGFGVEFWVFFLTWWVVWMWMGRCLGVGGCVVRFWVLSLSGGCWVVVTGLLGG